VLKGDDDDIVMHGTGEHRTRYTVRQMRDTMEQFAELIEWLVDYENKVFLITYPEGYEAMPGTLHDALHIWKGMKAQANKEREEAQRKRR